MIRQGGNFEEIPISCERFRLLRPFFWSKDDDVPNRGPLVRWRFLLVGSLEERETGCGLYQTCFLGQLARGCFAGFFTRVNATAGQRVVAIVISRGLAPM